MAESSASTAVIKAMSELQSRGALETVVQVLTATRKLVQEFQKSHTVR